jgi:hypothetical protein
MKEFIGRDLDVKEPVVSESNSNVQYISAVMRLLDVMRLENRSSCRFIDENARLELFVTVPTIGPFWP